MKVLICVLFFTFMILLNYVCAIPRKLYDRFNTEYYVFRRRIIDHPVGEPLGVLNDVHGHYFILNIVDEVVPYELPYYTLYDEQGALYLIRLRNNKLMEPLEPAQIGLVLVDLQNRYYTIQGDSTVIPTYTQDGPPCPSAAPIDGDKIICHNGTTGIFQCGNLFPEPLGSGSPVRYEPRRGDLVERYPTRSHKPWSLYLFDKWHYPVY